MTYPWQQWVTIQHTINDDFISQGEELADIVVNVAVAAVRGQRPVAEYNAAWQKFYSHYASVPQSQYPSDLWGKAEWKKRDLWVSVVNRVAVAMANYVGKFKTNDETLAVLLPLQQEMLRLVWLNFRVGDAFARGETIAQHEQRVAPLVNKSPQQYWTDLAANSPAFNGYDVREEVRKYLAAPHQTFNKNVLPSPGGGVGAVLDEILGENKKPVLIGAAAVGVVLILLMMKKR